MSVHFTISRPAISEWLLASLLCATISLASAAESASVRGEIDLRNWSIEQMPGGSVTVKNDALVIEDADGCTVWFRQKLSTPVEINYDVTVVAQGGVHDRVSDLNCFWMATDPRAPDGAPFSDSTRRSGKFEDYDPLRLYYASLGGNENTTTRFRRYAGDGTKPLLPEYDLRKKEFLLVPNHRYHLRITARDSVAEFWCDGIRIFSFKDPSPLLAGWFGFRTVHSHLEIRNFQVTTP